MEEGAGVNELYDDMTALGCAIMVNDAPIAQLLIENGANLTVENDEGHAPLLEACARVVRHDNYYVCKLLVKSGVDCNIRSYNRTPLLCAARWQSLELVKLLIAQGIEHIAVVDENKQTLLHHAAVHGSY